MTRLQRYLTALALIFLGAGPRLYQLGSRALWWDEGLSLFFARQDYVANARLAVRLADTNPPFYRLLLGYWLWFVGWSPFTARLFSALAGIVVIAIVYRLAGELGLSGSVRLTATALCAASPMLIYVSQEAKGYSLVMLAGAGSVALWLRLHRQWLRASHTPSAGLTGRTSTLFGWMLWSLTVLLAVGSHYIAVLLIGVENFWSVGLTVFSGRRPSRAWARQWGALFIAQAAAAVALLPFAWLTVQGTGAVARGETGVFAGLHTPAQFFGQHALELAAGPTAAGVSGWLAVVILGVLVVVAGQPTRTYFGLLSWVILPILAGFALNTYHEFFFPRYVAFVVPALLLLAALGISRVSRWLAGVFRSVRPALWASAACGLCLAVWSPTLAGYYTRPADPLEDWRPAAAALGPLLRPGDRALYVYGWIPGYLDAYLPQAPRPQYVLGYLNRTGVDAEMRANVAGATRVWLLDSYITQSDASNLAGAWLGEHAALVYDQWFGHAHLALFALPPTPNLISGTVTAEFLAGLRLTAPRLQVELAPGDALAIHLDWQATRSIAQPLTVYLHGLAPDGALAFGRDSEPRNGLAHVTDWAPGLVQTELRGLLIPPDLPPGSYTLQIGLYDTVSQQPDGTAPLTLGQVIIRPSPVP